MQANGIEQRLAAIESLCGSVVVENDSVLSCVQPLVTIACSRIGHDQSRLQRIAALTALAAENCKRHNGILLIHPQTAIAALAMRAADLFAIQTVRITTSESDAGGLRITNPNGKLSRDEVLIACADHIDAVHIRPKGTIDKAIRSRLKIPDSSIRVAAPTQPPALGHELIGAGAVGWFAFSESDTPTLDQSNQASPNKQSWIQDSDSTWTQTDGQWLVHCTRGRTDPWPGESDHQHLDNLLLGSTHDDGHTLTTLSRIVRGAKLVAAATVTDRRYPVVCFSEKPLDEILPRRTYRPHLHRWDNEPYGIAIRRESLQSIGARPVVYGDRGTRDALSAAERFAFQNRGKTYDWSEEAEWRTPCHVNLNQFDQDDVKVFVKTESEAQSIARFCPWAITVADKL